MEKFRITKMGDFFYPEIKTKGFKILEKLFGNEKWERIGKHTHGFGIYNDYNHGWETRDEANEIIEGYKLWISRLSKKTYEYLD